MIQSQPISQTQPILKTTKKTYGYFRGLILPAMVGLLGIYVVLHSPIRDSIAAMFGMKSRGCFFCTDIWSLNQIIDSLSALALICVALITSWILADLIGGTAYDRLLTLGVSALALIVVPAAMLGEIAEWMNAALLRPPFGLLLTALPSVTVIVLGVKHGWRIQPFHVTWTRPSNLVLLVGGTGIVLFFASVAISLNHPPTGYDALGYHAPLATFLWHDGNLGSFLDRGFGNWPLANPGVAELWFGLLQIVGSERLADLGQLPFALLASAATYGFTRRLNMPHGAALLAAGAFLLAPMVIMQSGMQLNDVVGAALLMTTIALASAPLSSWDNKRLALLGLSMGLVATTKLALLPCVAGVGLFVLIALVWQEQHRKNIYRLVIKLLIVALFFSLAVAPWWIRNSARYGNPLYPAALPLIGRGIFDSSKADASFVSSPVLWTIYPLLERFDEQSGFGALFGVALIPGVVLALVRGRRQPLVLYLLVTAIMLPAWWFLTQHFPRFLLGIAGLGFAFLPWSLLAVPRKQRRLAFALIVIAVVFSANITFDQALLPFARQPNMRAEFYDPVWGVDPVALALPENERLLFNTGYAPTIPEYTAYYSLLGPSQQRLVIPIGWMPSTDALVEYMKNAGVQYAYVTASPNNRATVEALYDRSRFDLIHVSTIDVGESSGARHFLYQPSVDAEEQIGTRRYLYRLK